MGPGELDCYWPLSCACRKGATTSSIPFGLQPSCEESKIAAGRYPSTVDLSPGDKDDRLSMHSVLETGLRPTALRYKAVWLPTSDECERDISSVLIPEVLRWYIQDEAFKMPRNPYDTFQLMWPRSQLRQSIEG